MKKIGEKWKSFFYNKQIRTRFLIVLISLSVIPLFILGVISYQIAKNTMIEKHVETNQNHLETVNEVADLMFDNVIKLHRLILINSTLQRELRMSADADKGESGVITYNDSAIQIQSIMSEYFIDQNHISSVCLLDNRYRAVCYGRSNNVGVYEGRIYEIPQSDWYQKMEEAQGKEVFFTNNVLEGKSNPDTFSSVKLLRDPTGFSHEKLGVLIVNLRKSIFTKMIPENSDNNFIVQDNRFTNVSIYDSRNADTSVEEPRSLGELSNTGYLITRVQNKATGWTFATAVSPEVLFKETNEISKLTIIIVFIMSIAAIILSVRLSKSITLPLAKIKRMMLQWAKGKRNFHEQFRNDEIGTIANTFKMVSKENDELNKRITMFQVKEREAELRILQSQINPHFLYNTLDSIYWMAIMEKNEKIAQMSISLSESFKIALNRGKETMPIDKELEHIRHYMTIQNIRYEGRFEFIEDIDDRLLGKEILKLLLQPLIENAVYHGIEPKVGKGTIKITGQLDGDFIIFSVSDNGVGIKDMSKLKQGFGVNNVRDRLNLYYGPSSTFHVESEVNKGTTITIRFPLERRGNGNAENGDI
ncbi:sensor histidine kinase [Gracilibacillus sp. YIM 98692]|uniref:sensor histidine kinase n=1 Tax=Gracilibacillus sp. YIM 98692 TaxID=2663532 RepID=UPI0013D2E11E|nr:sensor histidine kinase [Gracilibacillus sp. YIM 98692]